MKIDIKRLNNEYLLQAENDCGGIVRMDSRSEAGGKNQAMTPMQLLLAAIGGCSTIDLLSILEKQRQIVDNISVEVDGDKVKRQDYNYYKTIVLLFKLKGSIDPQKALRAIDLSLHKYCSVSKALEYSSDIRYRLFINGKEVVGDSHEKHKE